MSRVRVKSEVKDVMCGLKTWEHAVRAVLCVQQGDRWDLCAAVAFPEVSCAHVHVGARREAFSHLLPHYCGASGEQARGSHPADTSWLFSESTVELVVALVSVTAIKWTPGSFADLSPRLRTPPLGPASVFWGVCFVFMMCMEK